MLALSFDPYVLWPIIQYTKNNKTVNTWAQILQNNTDLKRIFIELIVFKLIEN